MKKLAKSALLFFVYFGVSALVAHLVVRSIGNLTLLRCFLHESSIFNYCLILLPTYAIIDILTPLHITFNSSLHRFFALRFVPLIASIALLIMSFVSIFFSRAISVHIFIFFLSATYILHCIFSVIKIKKGSEKKFDYIYYYTGALGLLLISGYEIDLNDYVRATKEWYKKPFAVSAIETQYRWIFSVERVLHNKITQHCKEQYNERSCRQVLNKANETSQHIDVAFDPSLKMASMFEKIHNDDYLQELINSNGTGLSDFYKDYSAIQTGVTVFSFVDLLLSLDFIKSFLEFVRSGLIIIIGKLIISIALAFKITTLSIELNSWYSKGDITNE